MASIVSAGTTSATALNMSADTTGILQLASNNGTVALTVDTSQNVGIGKAPSTSILDIAGEGQSGANNMYLTWSTTSGGYAPAYNLRKSNGTKASPTAVVNGDELGAVVFAGYDGSNYQNGAYIQVKVDSTPSANDMPARMAFFTSADGSASPTERMRISSAGYVTMPSQPVFEAFRLAGGAIALPQGTNVLLIYNSTQNNISGSYNTTTGRFTAPVAGFYQFNAQSLLGKVDSVRCDIVLYKNGSQYAASEYQCLTTVSTNNTVAGNWALPLAAGDYVEIYVAIHGGTSAGTVYVAQQQFNRFSGFLVA